MTTTSQYFTTDDGVKLHYLQAGWNDESKGLLILHPGWSQTAAQFSQLLYAFSDTYRVIALDPRGHGESEKPETGYRLSRLAKDLLNLLDHLKVTSDNEAIVLGHSGACAILWTFLEAFGQDRFKALVLVDHMACCLQQQDWSEDEYRNYGAQLTPQALHDFCFTKLLGPNGETERRNFVRAIMFSEHFPETELEQVLSDNSKFPLESASQLLWNVLSADFRDLLSEITVPTLCVGATASDIPPECMPWMASEIPNAEVTLMPGSHFMFLEEPEAFCEAVLDFLQSLHQRPPPVPKAMTASMWKRVKKEVSTKGGFADQSLVPDDSLEAW